MNLKGFEITTNYDDLLLKKDRRLSVGTRQDRSRLKPINVPELFRPCYITAMKGTAVQNVTTFLPFPRSKSHPVAIWRDCTLTLPAGKIDIS